VVFSFCNSFFFYQNTHLIGVILLVKSVRFLKKKKAKFFNVIIIFY